MTIVVGVASPDALVVASDSRMVYIDGERSRVASDFSRKLFSVGDRWVVASYGDAFVGRTTIHGLMGEFVAHLGGAIPDDVEALAGELGGFYDERFAAARQESEETWDVDELGWPLGFLLGGYDEHGVGHIREVLIPGSYEPPESAITTTEGGVLWRGQTDVIRRLLWGVDWTALETLEVEVPEELEEAMLGLQYISMPSITIQDAVDWASFLVRTTIGMQRFSDGLACLPGLVPSCGGPLQVIAVTRRGVRWIQRPTLAGPTEPRSVGQASAESAGAQP